MKNSRCLQLDGVFVISAGLVTVSAAAEGMLSPAQMAEAKVHIGPA